MRCAPTCLLAIAAASASGADIVPIQGTQSMSGAARVFPAGGPSKEDTFDISAPDPLTSWSPPVQDVSVAGGGPGGWSHVVATYSTTIEPQALRLDTSLHTEGTGIPLGGSGCQFEWNQPFSLKFTVTAPAVYVNQDSSWITPSLPTNLTFGPEGGPPLVALNIPAYPLPPFIASAHGPAIVLLPAGTYVLEASSATGPITSYHGPNIIDVRMHFVMSTCIGDYADCDLDGVRTVADFGCFQTKFAQGNPHADCNGDGQRTVTDFGCFQTAYVTACP